MATPKTILLRGSGIHKEAVANAAVTPGHLVELRSDGKIQVHGTAATTAQKAFALENEVVGKEIGDAYAAADNALYVVPVSGSEVYALLAAAAPAIIAGDFLESAGDGTLRKVVADAATDTAQRAAVVAVALEAVDNSGGGTVVRIRAAVL